MEHQHRRMRWPLSLIWWVIPAILLPASTYPIALSSGKHYLVDQTGAPFFINGDSPWYLGARLNAADVDTYLAERAAEGYNSIILNLVPRVVEWWSGIGQTTNIYGQNPFSSVAGGYTNFAAPNEAYFTNVDHIISSAASNGLCVFAYPLYAGYNGTEWYAQMVGNGPTAVSNYGAFIGNRYKNSPNIVWLGGGDYEMPDKNYANQLAGGIQGAGDTHLWSAQSQRPHTALEYYDGAWDNVNSTYPYFTTYTYSLAAYAVSPVVPSFMREAYYEHRDVNGTNTTPLICRSEAWWAVLSGDAGHFYGDEYQWPFTNGWASEMTASAAPQLAKVGTLMSTLQWQKIVPDSSHLFVTAGYNSGMNFAAAALAADGTLGMAYTPINQALTVDMTKFASTINAQWYDPTTGGFTSIGGSPFANSGSHVFSTPGNNAAGDADWVLVLDSQLPVTIGVMQVTTLKANQVRTP